MAPAPRLQFKKIDHKENFPNVLKSISKNHREEAGWSRRKPLVVKTMTEKSNLKSLFIRFQQKDLSWKDYEMKKKKNLEPLFAVSPR